MSDLPHDPAGGSEAARVAELARRAVTLATDDPELRQAAVRELASGFGWRLVPRWITPERDAELQQSREAAEQVALDVQYWQHLLDNIGEVSEAIGAAVLAIGNASVGALSALPTTPQPARGFVSDVLDASAEAIRELGKAQHALFAMIRLSEGKGAVVDRAITRIRLVVDGEPGGDDPEGGVDDAAA